VNATGSILPRFVRNHTLLLHYCARIDPNPLYTSDQVGLRQPREKLMEDIARKLQQEYKVFGKKKGENPKSGYK
jgi:hypothetical protein